MPRRKLDGRSDTVMINFRAPRALRKRVTREFRALGYACAADLHRAALREWLDERKKNTDPTKPLAD